MKCWFDKVFLCQWQNTVTHSPPPQTHATPPPYALLTLWTGGICVLRLVFWLVFCSWFCVVFSLCQYTLIKRLLSTASVLEIALRASSLAVYWIRAASGSPPNTTWPNTKHTLHFNITPLTKTMQSCTTCNLEQWFSKCDLGNPRAPWRIVRGQWL